MYGKILYVFDGERVKNLSGRIVLYISDKQVKDMYGKIIVLFDSTYIKKLSGSIEYCLDGFFSRIEKMAILTLLYAS